MDKSITRRYQKQREFVAHHLFNLTCEYVAAIEGKSPNEIGQAFESINLKWKLYVQSHKGKVKQLVELNINAFQERAQDKEAIFELRNKLLSA